MVECMALSEWMDGSLYHRLSGWMAGFLIGCLASEGHSGERGVAERAGQGRAGRGGDERVMAPITRPGVTFVWPD